MENKELYDSAYSKIQKLYRLIFDDNGDLKPEFYLTNEEIEAFRNHFDNSEDGIKHQLETLFGGIIYNKYTFKCEPIIIKNIFELSRQINLLLKKKNYSSNHNQIYARQAYNWNGNILFSTDSDCHFVKISLYNLEGTYEYNINLERDSNSSKIKGEIKIIRERRRVGSSSYYKDYGVESYDIRQISSKESSKETMDVLLITENELSKILNNLTKEATSHEKEQPKIRKR